MSDYYRNLDAKNGVQPAPVEPIHLAYPAELLVGVELAPMFDADGKYQPLIDCASCNILTRHAAQTNRCTRCGTLRRQSKS